MPTICRYSLVLLLIVVVPVACNRGPTMPSRGPLEGTVTLNGKPVGKGLIRFMAIDPNGINVLANITEGKYHVPAAEGPAKGKYRIEFSVPSATKRRVPNDDIPGQFIEEAPETLPPRYHRNSDIVRDYDPANSQAYDFNLTTP
jgi:hypothetical protein